MSRTPYVETEFLLAVMEERVEDALKIARAMLPAERSALRGQFQQGTDLLWASYDEEAS